MQFSAAARPQKKAGWKEVKNDRGKDGRTERWKEGQKDGRKDRKMKGRTEVLPVSGFFLS